MSTMDAPPANLVSDREIVESAVPDRAAESSRVVLAARNSAPQRCFDSAIAGAISTSRRVVGASSAPGDVWLLVWQHLAFDDLLSASHVCRGWRALAIGHARLWLRLPLRMNKRRNAPRSAAYASNIDLLRFILSRTKSLLLELDVEIGPLAESEEAVDDVRGLLDLVAPRLAKLHIVADPVWPRTILNGYQGNFPELVVFTVTQPSNYYGGVQDLDLTGHSVPKLVELTLPSRLRLSCASACPALRSLTCVSAGFASIGPLLCSARGLQRLQNVWSHASRRAVEMPPPDAALLAVLRDIADISLTAPFSRGVADALLGIFGASTAPQLRLVFWFTWNHEDTFRPRACSRLTAASHLRIAQSPSSTTIDARCDGAPGSLLKIRLECSASHGSPIGIDWTLMPAFDSLTTLDLSAEDFPHLLCNFPQAPSLEEVTLWHCTEGEIRRIVRVNAADRVSFPQATLTLMTVTVSPFGGHHEMYNLEMPLRCAYCFKHIRIYT